MAGTVLQQPALRRGAYGIPRRVDAGGGVRVPRTHGGGSGGDRAGAGRRGAPPGTVPAERQGVAVRVRLPDGAGRRGDRRDGARAAEGGSGISGSPGNPGGGGSRSDAADNIAA